MEELILFLMSFVLVFLIYQIFVVRSAKKENRKKKNKKEPIEVRYLVSRYHIDISKKEDYYQLLQIVALVSSFDISVIVSIMMLFDSFFLEILIVVITVVPVILVSYHLVGLFYQKKGKIKHD